MNILYIAYCCAPYNGSEASIGWEIPLNASKNNNVHLITVPESKPFIDRYLESVRNKKGMDNLHIYYVDISNKYKKIFKGALYTFRLNIWHKIAAKKADKICIENSIDIIHQITPVEFRSIGPYDKINNAKFICGPVGGGEYVPKELRKYLKGYYKTEYIRKVANQISRLKIRKRKLNILFANEETKKSVYSDTDNSRCITEIGISKEMLVSCNTNSATEEKNTICFLVAGRLLYRKGHLLLIDALKALPDDEHYICKIIGDGPFYNQIEKEVNQMNGKVKLQKSVTYTEMKNEYAKADVLIMPSLRETTGTVLLEALANGVPVITINKFGGHILLDDSVAWLYEGNTEEEYVNNLKEIISRCIHNREEVKKKADNAINYAKRYTWENKVSQYMKIYKQLIGD